MGPGRVSIGSGHEVVGRQVRVQMFQQVLTRRDGEPGDVKRDQDAQKARAEAGR